MSYGRRVRGPRSPFPVLFERFRFPSARGGGNGDNPVWETG